MSREDVIGEMRKKMADHFEAVIKEHGATLDEACIMIFQLGGVALSCLPEDAKNHPDNITWAIQNLVGTYCDIKGISHQIESYHPKNIQ